MSKDMTPKERAENYMMLKAGYKQSPLKRIEIVIDFYYKRGVNKERVNKVKSKILKKMYKL